MTDEEIKDTEEQTRVPMYEEWIAYPDKREFASTKAHEAYARIAGWWCTDWQGDEAAVLARGYKPQG